LYGFVGNEPTEAVDLFGLLSCGGAPVRSRYRTQSQFDTEMCKWELCLKHGNSDRVPIDELRQKCGDAVANHAQEWRDKHDFVVNTGISYWFLVSGVGRLFPLTKNIAVNAANAVLSRPGLIATGVGFGMSAGTRPGPLQALQGLKQMGFFDSSKPNYYPPQNIPLGY
jgi:hypothetical protein